MEFWAHEHSYERLLPVYNHKVDSHCISHRFVFLFLRICSHKTIMDVHKTSTTNFQYIFRRMSTKLNISHEFLILIKKTLNLRSGCARAQI